MKYLIAALMIFVGASAAHAEHFETIPLTEWMVDHSKNDEWQVHPFLYERCAAFWLGTITYVGLDGFPEDVTNQYISSYKEYSYAAFTISVSRKIEKGNKPGNKDELYEMMADSFVATNRSIDLHVRNYNKRFWHNYNTTGAMNEYDTELHENEFKICPLLNALVQEAITIFDGVDMQPMIDKLTPEQRKEFLGQ